jgi:hypothetical protein
VCSNYSGWFRGERETRETKAANAFQYVILGIFLVLAYGLWKLQVIESGSYASAAEKNQGDHNTPTGSSEIEEPFPFSGDPLAMGRPPLLWEETESDTILR